MSYQVLARKWRPRTFQEMVGQEPILRMLTNALDQQRLHHAYLFTGTRGVGKTTLARLLAKCLNCATGVTSKPCGLCSICTAIDAGKFLDLLEVDAASRTKVEDTRELLENVQYAPTQGRYKIYLIDEVHMLSGHSFNALLKTLEEPPAHVKFLLATTDPKRLPITVLSRCLQFNLKRVSPELITQHLQHVCTQEQIPFEENSLALLAAAADGSMRDALSLLDQAIAFCGEQLTKNDIQQMLGSIEQQTIFNLLQALANRDGKTLLTEMAHLAEQAPDFNQVLVELLSVLHQISIVQILADAPIDQEIIKKLATQLSKEDVQLFYQIALIGRRDLALASSPVQGFEMILLRMLAFRPVTESTQPALTNNPVPVSKAAPAPQKPAPLAVNNYQWDELLPQLELTGMAYALASNCTLTHINENSIELALSATHQPMYNKKLAERIEQSLSTFFKKNIKLDIKLTATALLTPVKQHQQKQEARLATATQAIHNDAEVQKILETFGATIDLIKPVEAT